MPNTLRRAWRSFVFPTPFLVAIVAWAESPTCEHITVWWWCPHTRISSCTTSAPPAMRRPIPNVNPWTKTSPRVHPDSLQGTANSSPVNSGVFAIRAVRSCIIGSCPDGSSWGCCDGAAAAELNELKRRTAMPMFLSSRLSSGDNRCSKMASFAYRSLLAGRRSLFGAQLISSSSLRRASAFL